MQQGPLPFHYAEENNSTGMTALTRLPAYLDLARGRPSYDLLVNARQRIVALANTLP